MLDKKAQTGIASQVTVQQESALEAPKHLYAAASSGHVATRHVATCARYGISINLYLLPVLQAGVLIQLTDCYFY